MTSNRDWLLDFQYNPATDYSGQYGSLFGADSGGDYFYGGPNSNWRHALDDRLKKGSGFGWYELSASNMDRDAFRKMTERNNIIQSMYDKGYSMDQLNAHMAGERNVLEEGPAGHRGGTISWDSSVGQAGSAWGPSEDSPRLFSEENEQMRKAIGENLEKKALWIMHLPIRY